MTNVTTKYSPLYGRDFQLTVVNTARGFHINVTSELIKDIKKMVLREVFEIKLNGNAFTKVFDYKVNVCDLINFTKRNSLIRIVSENLMKSSNFQLKCPFKQVENSKTFF